MLKRFIILLFLVPVGLQLKAQTNTSPYSIIGIGDIESKDYGKFFGMASTSIGMQSGSYVNLSNPASLTSLDPNMFNLDFNVRFRSSQYKYPGADTFTSSYSDAQLERFSLTFRPGKTWGVSFGLKPFSSSNYNLSELLDFGNGSNSNILRTVNGSGGINQVYLANAFKINKNFSLGLTSSFLFGTLKRSTSYVYPQIDVNIQRNEYQILKGFQFQGGLQYTGKITNGLRQTIGLTISNPLTLKGRYEMQYLNIDSTLNPTIKNNQSFKIPLQFGAGYSLVVKDVFTIAADYRYSDWSGASLNYPNAYTTPTRRYSFGLQYAPIKNIGGQMRERFFIQGGVAYEEGYVIVDNKQLNDMSATVGLGGNINRLINAYVGVEFGSHGKTADKQIQEQFTQVSLGITLKEFWLNTRKLKKYN
jgi:opacity protein-like surface antigen